MAQQLIQSGIVVEYPDDLKLEELSRDPEGLAGMRNDHPHADDLLTQAIENSPTFDLITAFQLQGGVSQERLGALREPTSGEEVVVRAPLGPDEQAVIISDADGVIRWEYPETIEEAAAEVGGLGAATETTRYAVFKSGYQPEEDRENDPQKLGFIGDVLLKPIKKFILRFTARKAGQVISKFLEKDIVEGPMQLKRQSESDPGSWEYVDSWDHVSGDKPGQPLSILLFVHGTFSSTQGSFGGLSITDQGREFLDSASQKYDAILGFNHKTLTKTVTENATGLLQVLSTLPDVPMTIDFVAFSRGGLVTRYLFESLIPQQSRKFPLREGVFVGCTNNGTKLADPNNWKDLLDLYSNVVTGATKVASRLGGPKVKIASKIFNEAMQGAFSFGCYLASEATTGSGIPGLASMDPGGTDVQVINQRQTGQPGPEQIQYNVVETDFEHDLFGDHQLREMGLRKRLFMELADRVVDQLFKKAPNDLVVDRDSMSTFDANPAGPWVKDRLSFEPNEGVYHTVYFYQPQTTAKLSAWLL